MPRTLANASDHADIRQRIASLTPASQSQWGAMTVGGMICHLDDACRMGLGEIATQPIKLPLPVPVIKFISLRLPMKWPRNLPTAEEVRQGGGGTPSGTFTDDQTRLLENLDRLCACKELDRVKHPFFGVMTHADWMRWGYLHVDHHLRQFVV